MRKIIVKEGPLVFVRNLFLMEFLAGLFMYLVSFLENYEMLYRNLNLDKILRYDIFLILIFSAFQLIYITLLFFDWYFSYFEINNKEIIRKSGIVFRSRKSIDLTEIISVEIYESPLERLMSHSSIALHHKSSDRISRMRNVANADEYAHMIKQFIRENNGQESHLDLRALIKTGENFHLELKQTLRFDVRKNEVSKEVEKSVLKTIVGFLNTDGGNLLIGVADSGEIYGLERDFMTLAKKNTDGFENHLNQLIKTMIGVAFAKYIEIKFDKIDDLEVCLVRIMRSHRPAYLKNSDQKEEFFVRVGNATQPLSMSETEEYISSHWK